MARTLAFMDLSRLCLTSFTTGIQRVAKEIVLRLLEDPEMELTLLAAMPSQNAWRILPHESFRACYTESDPEKRISPFGEGRPRLLTPQEIPSDAVFFDIDSAWNMPMHRSWLFPILKERGVTIVSHVYDLIPVTEPQYFFPQTTRQFLAWISAVLRYADHIICNAEATKQVLHQVCGQLETPAPPCTVIPLGADFCPKSDDGGNEEPALLHKLPKYRYVLAVGTIEPRKNHALLLDAAEALAKEGIQTVFAGRIGWNMEEFSQRMQKHPLNGKAFFFAESPTDATIRSLYKNALAVVIPSKNEGFGLPIIEAFLNGTPVLASDIPVLREVGGELAGYFDNTSTESLVQAVLQLASDDAAYQEKRKRIAAYRPRTWDTTAAEMSAELKKCGSAGEDRLADCKVSQMVMLTARNDDLLRTLPYLDANLPFLERVLVCCPQRNVAELQEAWKGRIKLEFYTDEELLGGEALPEDHTTRNFFLRCLIMRKAPLDDVFIMSDDDYRPLMPLSQEVFLREHRFQAYYCYDLREWHGTQGNYTSFDKSMFRTRDFLEENGFPTLMYSSHQPQILSRSIYLELLDRFPEISLQGLDEWSTYFNYGVAKYPHCFQVQPYCSAGWPGSITDWRIDVFPEHLYFENFYDALYEEGRVFAHLSKNYDAAKFSEESTEKILRWSRELEKQRQQRAQQKMFQAMVHELNHRAVEFLLEETEEGPEWHTPGRMVVTAGSVLRMDFEIPEALRFAKNAVLRWGMQDAHRNWIVPQQCLLLADVDKGCKPELVFPAPSEAGTGILALEYEAGKRAAVQLSLTIIP